jgi:glycosyl transferase family 25
MKTCNVYVISMSDETARRTAFANRAVDARASWQFVDAATSAPAALPYRESASIKRLGRPLGIGEVGCFASHWAVWKQIVESNQSQALVLEDDTIVDWQALDLIVDTDLASLGIDLLRLYSTHPFKYRLAINRFLGPHSHLVETRGLFLGTQGYAVTRRGALRMLQLAQSIEMPIDWYMSRYWRFGFRNYCLFPFPLIENLSPSNIGERANPYSPSPTQRLHRVAARVSERFVRAVTDHVWFSRPEFGLRGDYGPPYASRAWKVRP